MPTHTIARAAVAALALVAGACGSGDDPAVAPPETTVTTATTATTADTTVTSAATGTLIEVTVAGGEVQTAEDRVRVPLGRPVTIRVTSDAPDELHVHGYDLTRTVEAGAATELTFTADIPGIFDVELHDVGHAPVVQLEVS